jgi:hypothetical protein
LNKAEEIVGVILPAIKDPQGGARTRHGVKKTAAAAAVAAEGRFAMKTVAEVIGVSRSNLIERMRERPKKRIGRPPIRGRHHLFAAAGIRQRPCRACATSSIATAIGAA